MIFSFQTILKTQEIMQPALGSETHFQGPLTEPGFSRQRRWALGQPAGAAARMDLCYLELISRKQLLNHPGLGSACGERRAVRPLWAVAQ